MCQGVIEANGRTIEFEGGPALEFIIQIQRNILAPVSDRYLTFKKPSLSLAAAFWAERNIEPEFKFIRIIPRK